MIQYRYILEPDTPSARPLRFCPDCGQDLTVDDSVVIHVSIGGRETDVTSKLDASGLLIDTADEAVAHGFHAGTLCGGCDDLLIDMAGVVEQCTE